MFILIIPGQRIGIVYHRYGAQLLIEGKVTFVEMETAIFTLMLGALGLGIAFADLGDQQEGLNVANRVFKSIEEGAFLFIGKVTSMSI